MESQSLMESFTSITGIFAKFIPALGTAAVCGAILYVVDFVFGRRAKRIGAKKTFTRHIVMLVLTAVGIVAIILALPLEESTQDQLFGLLGIVLTGIIALSSTTIVSNAMAGLMIRSIGSFRSGDFVRVGDQFGRVSERGLFHTEIQTEDRELVTLPNMYLIANPVSVVRTSGTIISASISLGYDTGHEIIEPLLLEGALAAGLEEPYVQILDLGDYTVNYRIAGFLKEIKQLVTMKSKLRIHCLDTLHRAGIEVMSPSVMMQRPIPDSKLLIPEMPTISSDKTVDADKLPEEIIFDKAEKAAAIDDLRYECDELMKELEVLLSQVKESEADESTKRRIDFKKRRISKLQERIEEAESGEK